MKKNHQKLQKMMDVFHHELWGHPNMSSPYVFLLVGSSLQLWQAASPNGFDFGEIC
jgi:hypothetical protein